MRQVELTREEFSFIYDFVGVIYSSKRYNTTILYSKDFLKTETIASIELSIKYKIRVVFEKDKKRLYLNLHKTGLLEENNKYYITYS